LLAAFLRSNSQSTGHQFSSTFLVSLSNSDHFHFAQLRFGARNSATDSREIKKAGASSPRDGPSALDHD
jgi:hypothetical protein